MKRLHAIIAAICILPLVVMFSFYRLVGRYLESFCLGINRSFQEDKFLHPGGWRNHGMAELERNPGARTVG